MKLTGICYEAMTVLRTLANSSTSRLSSQCRSSDHPEDSRRRRKQQPTFSRSTKHSGRASSFNVFEILENGSWISFGEVMEIFQGSRVGLLLSAAQAVNCHRVRVASSYDKIRSLSLGSASGSHGVDLSILKHEYHGCTSSQE